MKTPMLNIRGLRARPVVVPMRLPLQTSTGAVSMAPLVLIDLDTTAGITGRAYLFAIGRPHLAPIVALVEAMGEMIEGDAVAPFEIERKLRRKHTLLGVHNIVLFALAGIDMAAWDAYAQSLAQPLCKVLGGAPRPVRAYNSKGLGIMPLKPLAREAGQLVKEGFSAVKLRLGRPDPRDDLAALRTVKKALGPDVTLMCDFNQALTVNDAILRGRMLDDEGGLYWIEEPTRADDFDGNAASPTRSIRRCRSARTSWARNRWRRRWPRAPAITSCRTRSASAGSRAGCARPRWRRPRAWRCRRTCSRR